MILRKFSLKPGSFQQFSHMLKKFFSTELGLALPQDFISFHWQNIMLLFKCLFLSKFNLVWDKSTFFSFLLLMKFVFCFAIKYKNWTYFWVFKDIWNNKLSTWRSHLYLFSLRKWSYLNATKILKYLYSHIYYFLFFWLNHY